MGCMTLPPNTERLGSTIVVMRESGSHEGEANGVSVVSKTTMTSATETTGKTAAGKVRMMEWQHASRDTYGPLLHYQLRHHPDSQEVLVLRTKPMTRRRRRRCGGTAVLEARRNNLYLTVQGTRGAWASWLRWQRGVQQRGRSF